MTSCCPPRPMQWNVVTGAIARCKSKSTGYARKRKSVRAWRWTCGVKPTPKAVNKPWQHCIVHGLDKPGVFTTDSTKDDTTALYEVGCTRKGSMCRKCLYYSDIQILMSITY